MEPRPDAGSTIPISAARLYPHVADDEGGTDMPIVPGPMDVTHLAVEVGVRGGTVSLVASTHRDDLDPFGVAFDLTPAAAGLLAQQLEGTADAATAHGVDADDS
jgi:hypothetical protein